MDNKSFSTQLQNRTIDYAVKIIKMSSQLPLSPEAKVIRNQITKSGSSIGANYHEANRSRSPRDFANKIKISESEGNETIYWLKVIDSLQWFDHTQLNALEDEANQLVAIFTSIGNKLKNKT